MESIKCPKCRTITFKERGKCPRCNYDFSHIDVETQTLVPRVIFVVREGVPQTAKKVTSTVNKILENSFKSIGLEAKKSWKSTKRVIVSSALFVGKIVEAFANVLFAPILYLFEIIMKVVVVVASAFAKTLAIVLVGNAKLWSAVRSIPELFSRRKKRLLPKVERAFEVKSVKGVSFLKTPGQGVTFQKPLTVSKSFKSVTISEPMRSAAVEVAPPLVRPFPRTIVREPVSFEGVEVMPAGIFSRLFAAVIDILIISATVCMLLTPAWLAGSFSFLTLSPERFAKVSLTIYLFVIAITGIYLIVSMSVYGKTFGKKLFGLRVIKVSGEPLNLYDAVIRFFAWLISGLFFGLGWLWLVFDLNHRSLHDYLCNTVVIKDVS